VETLFALVHGYDRIALRNIAVTNQFVQGSKRKRITTDFLASTLLFGPNYCDEWNCTSWSL